MKDKSKAYICICVTSALEVELGRDQGAAFLGRRGGKNWGEFLATPIWGENRQLHVYLRKKKPHMKRDIHAHSSALKKDSQCCRHTLRPQELVLNIGITYLPVLGEV